MATGSRVANKNAKELLDLADRLKVLDRIQIPLSRLDSRALSVITLRLNTYIIAKSKGLGYIRTSRIAKYLCRLVREQDQEYK